MAYLLVAFCDLFCSLNILRFFFNKIKPNNVLLHAHYATLILREGYFDCFSKNIALNCFLIILRELAHNGIWDGLVFLSPLFEEFHEYKVLGKC